MEENSKNLLEHFIKLMDSLGKLFNYFHFLILRSN